jgi:hypothetical protein
MALASPEQSAAAGQRPRIALIHATPVAIDPVAQAFATDWPEAEIVNILEDSLSPDRAKADDLTEAMTGRIVALARYAGSTGADGILFTCSAFGPAIEKAATLMELPVLKPNEAMFEQAIETGGDVAMLATFGPAVASMEAEFAEQARLSGVGAKLKSILVDGAMDALRSGDAARHNELVAEAAARLSGVGTIMLAHFSTSRAAAALRQATALPVLTSPGAAVAKMKRLVKG